MEVHSTMFIPSLESQTTPEQKEKWLPKAASYEIVGTYAQTELGHGNYLIFECFMQVCWPLFGLRTTFEFLVLFISLKVSVLVLASVWMSART